MYSSFQEYLVKYEKEYHSLIKKVDNLVLKEINQKISEFTKDESLYLGEGFYQKLLNIVAPILR